MADYSGHRDPWTKVLTDTWLKQGKRYCWGSYKDFSSDGPYTEVPFEFLGLLIDGHYDGIKRNFKYYADKWRNEGMKRPVIKWNGKKKCWQMKNGFSPTDKFTREWLTRAGYLDENGTLVKPIGTN